MTTLRLGVVVTHPIQYYAPLWRALAAAPELELRVFFASRIGVDRTFDPVMKTEIAWATDLTAGYAHEFLPGAASIKQTGFAVDNPGVGAALARFRPDAVILHGYASKTLLRALLWCKLHRVRTLLTADSSTHGAPPGWRRRVKMLVAPWLLGLYDAALTMGDRSEAHLAAMGYPRARMHRTPTMMDAAFWSAREGRAALRAKKRAELGVAPDAFVVLAVSKLSRGKRIADLIRAFAGLGAGATLVVAGEGEERARLEAEAEGLNVRLLGFVNIDALPSLYAAADVFAHPGEKEQYGMVAIEAAILGLPLVLSDETGAVGPTSIAREGENALVFPVGDVAALGERLMRLRGDDALRAKMADASLLFSQDHAGPKSVEAVLAAATARKASRGDLPKR